MTTIAIIPARGGSKGLKKKNILPLLGKPLIGYSIESALNSNKIDKVIVSTDNMEIAEIAKKFGAEVPFMRPDELAGDKTPTIDVLSYTLARLEKEMDAKIDHMVLLQPTSPLRTTQHINDAIDLYFEHKMPVISVSEAKTHPFLTKKMVDGRLVNFIEQSIVVKRRQDLEPAYELNGAIYITSRDMIIEKNCLYEDLVYPYVMNKQHSVDIDDRLDFLFAELLIKENSGGMNGV